MTTSLIKGLSFDEAAAAVRDAAIARRGENCAGVWTETGKEKVLVGLAQPGRPAFTLEMDRAEWDGLAFLRIIQPLKVST